MVRVGSLVDQDDVTPKLRENKTNMTAREQIDAVIDRVRELNGRRDKVYARLMEKLEEQGVRLVDFRKIGRQESERLERYFDSEIAPLISPSIVGRRQPFPFLRNKDIYAVVVLEGKKGKYKLGIIPCSAGVFPRLIEVSASEKTYMLAEDLILHFIPKVFEGYVVKAKSLMRVTRNADIDADALYDDDLDYREFMVELIKRRKRLAPVRLELSRELDGIIVDTLCRYMDVPREYVFMSATPLDFSFLFGLEDVLRQRGELFYERRIPQKSPAFVQRPVDFGADSRKGQAAFLSLREHEAVPRNADGSRQRRQRGFHQDDAVPRRQAEQGRRGALRGGGKRQGRAGAGRTEGAL